MPSHHPASRLAEIRKLLKTHNITPNRRLGQNFLTDLRPAELLAEAAREIVLHESTPAALEIGMGLGHLTEQLVSRGFSVVAVEIDRRLSAAAEKRLHDAGIMDRVTIVTCDAVKRGELVPEVREALGKALSPGGKYVLASNLPYSAASPVIVWHALNREAWAGSVVMVQKEIAERLAAQPGGKEWGSLGLLASAAFCDMEVLKEVRPGAFFPRPKVDSAVVRFLPRVGGPVAGERMGAFAGYSKRIFSQRRKTLKGALAIFEWELPEGVEPSCRVDKLSVEGHVQVFEANRAGEGTL